MPKKNVVPLLAKLLHTGLIMYGVDGATRKRPENSMHR